MSETVAIAADHGGFELKSLLVPELRALGFAVLDLGTVNGDAVDYPDFAQALAAALRERRAGRGVLICGTGIGMAISANKVAGIRATTAHDSFSAERSVLSNNCQVLTMGQRVIGLELARRLVREWLGYVFDEQSASAQKVAVISAYESANPGS